jgi:hypothetical protein
MHLVLNRSRAPDKKYVLRSDDGWYLCLVHERQKGAKRACLFATQGHALEVMKALSAPGQPARYEVLEAEPPPSC